MDRSLPALAALAAVLLVSLCGLAVFQAGRPDPRPTSPRQQVYDLSAANPAGAKVAARLQDGVPPADDWLPSLSDGARTVLAESAAEEPPVRTAGFEAAFPEAAGPRAAIAPSPPRPVDVAPVAVEPALEVQPRPADHGPLEAELLLMPAHDGRRRSHELELIARQADAHTQYGFELAGRGVRFSARAEFVMALRLVAQGLDAEYRTAAHACTLAAGLTALAEAEDFVPGGSNLEAHLDLPAIVRSHRTPIFKDTAPDGLAPLDAMNGYLTFAQEQLSYAAGGEIAGSMALYGLGKLHKAMAEDAMPGVRAARPKAVVFYQASLLASPRNYMASNDLGVMLFQSGRYEDARAALEHSVSICPQACGWHNLAAVYRHMGLSDSAGRAELLASAGRNQRPGQLDGAEGAVRWVDPYAFAQSAGQTLAADPPARTAAPAPSPAPASPPKQAAGWLPWNILDLRK